jgi:integrase
MEKIKFTDTSIAKLKPRGSRYLVRNVNLGGHYIRVFPSGTKTHYALARDPSGKQVWHTIGDAGLLKAEEAEELARAALKSIKKGEDRARPQSFEAVAELWFKRHVLKADRKLRSHSHIRYYLDRHILPAWAGRDFTSIRRGDVTLLLDTVEDGSGPVAADKTLGLVSNIMNWYATRHDDYSSPIIKGMRRSNPKERARTRILDDEELRIIWTAANGAFGALVRLLLLTAQRRDKVASMQWGDIQDGVWRIPTENREKGNAVELILPQMALDIIEAQPRFAGSPFVIARKNCHTKDKADLVAKMPPMPQWQLHDLRRTARSLMSRAGVLPHIAERVLGHALQGVEGTYDRHAYDQEKGHALNALAGLIEKIVNPPADNVVSLEARAR